MGSRLAILIALAAAVAGCNRGADDVVDVAFIATPDEFYAAGQRLETSAQHLRAAQAQGLVRLDATGEVVPGLAEAWIVTDDGMSYIFRIKEFDLPGGKRLTAKILRDSVVRSLAGLRGTSLGADLAAIDSVKAMAGRVIEFRLKAPTPGFLRLLAQPELGFTLEGAPAGPMQFARVGDVAVLAALPPEARGLPRQPDWGDDVREVRAYAVDAQAATRGFSEGRFDILLGGRLATLPLASTGPLSRGTVRLDSAIGLFGLDVVSQRGFLAKAENRAALAMAIDRDTLLAAFNIGGWIATTRIVAPDLPGETSTLGERWAGQTLAQRQGQARARVAAWRAAEGGPPRIRIALPPGPGSNLLFQALDRDFAAIGVEALRAGKGETGDLALRDRVARYGSARWFLDQFACPVARSQCVPEADAATAEALTAPTPAAAAAALEKAERLLTAANLYIPLGAPIRWSQVRAGTVGFSENPWNVHPLFPLSRAPI